MTVRDLRTNDPIARAEVEVILTRSTVDNNRDILIDEAETNEDGVVRFTLPEDGVYAVSIKASEDYLEAEGNATLECNVRNCDSCSADLTVKVPQRMCEKQMPITVRDTLYNRPVVWANIVVAVVSEVGELVVFRGETEGDGIVEIPVEGTNTYKITVEKEGYICLLYTSPSPRDS